MAGQQGSVAANAGAAYEKMRRQLIEALARPDQAIPWV
jgi:hypothetical protein